MATRKKAFAIGLICLLNFTLSFAVYLRTMAPTLTWRHAGSDGGDLIVAVGTLGIPHPSGYPTFVILGRVFALLPVGDLAYRMNLMSGILAALAIALVFLTILHFHARWEGPEPQTNAPSLIAAGAASLSLAFAPIFWSQALIAEVYAPTAFFAALLIFLMARWLGQGDRRGSPWWLAGAGLSLGIGLGLHLTLIFLAPLIASLLISRRRDIPRTTVVLGAALFILGLGVYLYLPLRASSNPPVNWGNPSGIEGFLWELTGVPYRQNVMGVPLQFIPSRLLAWAGLMLQQFNALGLTLGIVGWAYLWRRDRGFFMGGLSSFALSSAYSITYNTTDSYVYLIPALIIYTVDIGAGLYFVMDRYIWPWLSSSGIGWQFRVNAGIVALLLLLLLPGFSIYRNFPEIDISKDRAALFYGEEAFRAAAPDSLILVDKDTHIFALWYYRYVVEPNSNVKVIAKPLLQFPWYRENLARSMREAIPSNLSNEYSLAVLGVIRHNLSKRDVYVTRDDDGLLTGFQFQRKGPLFLLKAPQR